jgi:hypothetical protein
MLSTKVTIKDTWVKRMANKKTTTEAAQSAESLLNRKSEPLKEPPPEWRDVEQRATGFWNAKIEKGGQSAEEFGPICGRVVSARTFQNKRKRETTVFYIKLDYPCVAVRVDGDLREFVELQKGEVCGVFESAGLTALRQRANCRVWVKREGVRKTDNGEMKVYKIKSPDDPKPVTVEEWKPRAERGAEPDDKGDDIDEIPF